LPRPELRNRNTVKRFEVERTLGAGTILEFPACDAEFPPAGPRACRGMRALRSQGGVRIRSGPAMTPECKADPSGKLNSNAEKMQSRSIGAVTPRGRPASTQFPHRVHATTRPLRPSC
jgi:hypothetical protein